MPLRLSRALRPEAGHVGQKAMDRGETCLNFGMRFALDGVLNPDTLMQDEPPCVFVGLERPHTP